MRRRSARGLGSRVCMFLLAKPSTHRGTTVPTRAFLLFLVVALAYSTLLASTRPPSGGEDGPPVGPVAEAADQAAALHAARRQGARVEVADQRTPTRAVYANPSGTLTAEVSVTPTRVRRDDGWAPVDATLVSKADGRVGPRAAVGDLSMSGGGSKAPLVRMEKDGASLSLYWPGELPAPRIDGATATYPDVLPGVDLVMSAGSDGYRQHLVVEDPEAAKNPALARLALRIETVGLRLEVDAAGVTKALGATGEPVFVAPPATMWDSSGTEGARSAPVRVTVQNGALVLEPDQAFLADPTVVYPVTIDPDMRTWDKSNWASVASGRSGTSYWWTSAAPNGGSVAQVGQCWNGRGECNSPSIGELWAYFQFDTSFVAGRRILGAEFRSVVVSSPNCDARNHQLYVVPNGGQIYAGMNWGSKLNGGLLAEVSVPGACDGNKPVGWGFPRPDGIGGVASFFLKAASSTDQIAWRKYDPGQTKLSVTYNTVPNPPATLTTDPPLPEPCRWCAGTRYFSDRSIRLVSTLSDFDGGLVRPKWRVSLNNQEIASWDGGYQTSGATHDTTISLADKDGGLVGWWLHADDGTDASGPVAGPSFMVDLKAPERGPVVKGVLYPQDNRWHGGVGVPDTFTFSANPVAGESNDIDHYLYGFEPSPSTRVDATGALGGSATVTLAPPADGPQTLYVRSVDRAGHRSKTTTEYRFYVRAGNGPLAQWSFEDNANDTAFLGDRHGTLNGGVTYSTGAVNTGIQLDGQTGSYATAPNAVRTDASFSVSAWVKASELPDGRGMGVVQQNGNRPAGFYLDYRGDTHRTTFTLTGADTDDPWSYRANGPEPQLDTWTHIAGVYDRHANKIRLYVNGSLAQETALPANFVPWNATGPVEIGRQKWNGIYGNHWHGSIDEVQLHDRALTETEIRAAVGEANVQVAHWRFDDGTGTTARDAVIGGPMGVLQGGASFSGKGAVKGSVRLDGTDDHVATTGPVVRTDRSFSVAAWVKLDRVDAGTYTVLSQDGNRICGFCLQYQGSSGQWVFVLPGSDSDSPATYDFVATTGPAPNLWTHLAATYDAGTGTLRLYVDGQFAGEKARVATWTASGVFAIGRARTNGISRQFLPGSIDEVRVFSRAISLEEVQGLVGADGVTAGTWAFDGNATDSSGRDLHGTPGGTQDWAAGQTNSPDVGDLAVKLDGSTGYVSAPNAVDTTKSFSATAWVRLDRGGSLASVVSEDGTTVGGFVVRATADGRWSFATASVDANDATVDKAETAPGAAQVGVWTHLAAVYNTRWQRLELYVNGTLVGSAVRTKGFGAAGELQIGRLRWNGGYRDYLSGAVDDVHVYTRALFADEIRVMAGRDMSLAHDWRLDETSGSNAADAVGVRGGTLLGGASFGPGRVDNAVRLDGEDDSVATTGVDVRTDQSFTVGAWVYLEENECDLGMTPRCVATAVSVDGTRTSKFRLGHVRDEDQAPRGKWIFEMPESDTDDSPAAAALSVEPGEVGKWVHLVGVYDAAAKRIWLYVNGNRVADGSLSTAWQADGGLQIGRGKAAGAAAEYWHGSVDDVRVYTGPQDKDRIAAWHRSYPSAPAPAAVPAPDLGRWRFDEGSGTTVADGSGMGRPASLLGGATWRPARNEWGVQFDGTTGYAETAASKVIDTSRSFSVSAWTFATASSSPRTVLGEDGDRVSTFALQYRPNDARWVVRVPKTDTDDPEVMTLTSTEPVVAGQWTHLTVVYDAPQHLMRLYVNGGLSAVQFGITVPDGTGPLSVGRGRWNGANAEFFRGGVDDVRAFGKIVSDGEVRKIYDDVPLAVQGYWRFDGNGADTSWRQNSTVLSGTPTYTAGVNDRALQLDGTSVAATASGNGVPMIGSFTVSAWAKLARTDRVQTVLGEDGGRTSGYVLQYRPELNRWVFGAPTQDADGAGMVLAASAQPPVADSWTHLTGVYDYPARKLRLYVDGQLAGIRDNVLLWAAWQGFTIGRGKVDGAPANFFAGAIDEVTVNMGAASDAEIARWAAYPAPAAGQLGRYVNGQGDRYTSSTDAPVPAGYHFEASLGIPAPAGAPNTRVLYACMFRTDAFTSTDPACEGQTVIGTVGSVYTVAPAGVPATPVHRCYSGGDHLDSLDATCAGKEFVLGYTVGYASMVRYNNQVGWDHLSTVDGAPPGYKAEWPVGYLSLTEVQGGLRVYDCRVGIDRFTSTDAACEGGTVWSAMGWMWAQPPDGVPSTPVYRCRIGTDRFDSRSADCEGQTVEGLLGYAVTATPAPAN